MEEAEGFLDEMLLCFPICNIRIFEKPTEATLQTRILQLSAKGLVAKGYEEPQGFVVMKGSQSPIETVPSIPSHLVSVRDLMREERILAEEDGILAVKEDYSFTPPLYCSWGDARPLCEWSHRLEGRTGQDLERNSGDSCRQSIS